jgi:hypothetical protein
MASGKEYVEKTASEPLRDAPNDARKSTLFRDANP